MSSQLAEVRNKLAAINNNQLSNEWQDNPEINDLDQEFTDPEEEQSNLQEQIDLLEDDNFAASQGRKTIFMYITIGVLMVVLAFVWFRSTMAGIYENFKNTNALNGLGINSNELTPIDQALKDMKQELPAIKEVTQTQINSVINKNSNTNSNVNQNQLQQQLIEETKNKLQNLPTNNNTNTNSTANLNSNINQFNF